jgi:hypothetical protein
MKAILSVNKENPVLNVKQCRLVRVKQQALKHLNYWTEPIRSGTNASTLQSDKCSGSIDWLNN